MKLISGNSLIMKEINTNMVRTALKVQQQATRALKKFPPIQKEKNQYKS